MKKKLLLSFGFLIGLWTFCMAQNPIIPNNDANRKPYENYLPKDIGVSSPQIWSFMKYGGSMPNLYTGTVSASIPIYTYSDVDFTLPISLNYASNGYIPNVQANDVGLGWFLNAGGSISKEVRGIPDNDLFGTPAGYSVCDIPDLTNTEIAIQRLLYPPEDLANRNLYGVMPWGSPLIETEPDIYTFNFLGCKGKFMFAGRRAHVFDTEDPHGEYNVRFDDKNIEIVTGDGYVYTFIPSILSNRGYKTVSRGNAEATQFRDETNIADGWVLSKIKAPNGRHVDFDYKISGNEMVNFRPGGSQGNVSPENITPNFFEYDFYYLGYRQETPQILSITVDGGVKISFNYGDRKPESHAVDNSARSLLTPKKLESIRVTTTPDATSTTLENCTLSYAYASAAGNPVMFLGAVDISGIGTYRMEYYKQSGIFPFHGTVSIDHWGYYNSEPNYDLRNLIPEIECDDRDNFPLQNYIGPLRAPNAEYAKRGVLTKITYPTGGHTEFEYEPHSYVKYMGWIDAVPFYPSLMMGKTEVQTGGVRISRVKDYTGGSQVKTRTYDYGTGTNGTGILLNKPIYYTFYEIYYREYPLGPLEYHRVNDYSATDVSAYHVNEMHIGYSEVSEKFDDGSKITYKFADYNDWEDEYNNANRAMITSDIRFGRSAALHEKVVQYLTKPDYFPPFRGKLLNTTYYNSSNNPVKMITNVYDKSEKGDFVESTLVAGDILYTRRSYLESFPLVKVITKDLLQTVSPTYSERLYEYNEQGQVTCTRQVGSDGARISDYNKHVFDIPEPQRTTMQKAMVATNYVIAPVSSQQTIARSNGAGGYEAEKIVRAEKYDYTTLTNALAKTFLRPSVYYRAEIESEKSLSENLVYKPITSYSYDSGGRVIQVVGRDGIPVTYVWGYGGLFPVATLFNAVPSDVKRVLGSTEPLAEGLSDAQDAALRSISYAFVTTYKYDPHVGITDIKDPIGCLRSFTYNAHGKLSVEYDNSGRRVRGYSYSTDNR